MANALQQAGALSEPSNFAPLHTNRIFTGLWTNRSPLRDAATTDYMEHYGMGRQDSIWSGDNSEISSRLTLRRRPGSSVYNANVMPPVKRFYSFNTFTLTDEVIRVMADTATAVYDATAPDLTSIFTKSAGAGSTYFLGVGNTLYFTNGVDNMQVKYDPATGTWGAVVDWGIDAPINAPAVNLTPLPNPYGTWRANTGYSSTSGGSVLAIQDSNGKIQQLSATGITGAVEPAWGTTAGAITTDGTVGWKNMGPAPWVAGTPYLVNELVIGLIGGVGHLYWCSTAGGASGAVQPTWVAGIGVQVPDGGVVWTHAGAVLKWADIGAGVSIITNQTIIDPNGYDQGLAQSGKSSPIPPAAWQTTLGAFTVDGSLAWKNFGPFFPGGTGPVQYGYEYMDSSTGDLSNMSPASTPITVAVGTQVTVSGDGSADPQVDTIVIFRTAQGGSTFLYLDQIPNTGAPWSYIDSIPDSGLNTEWQAQRGGEGTPLPAGATCLGYHLGRIFAAVGNVVWVSSGPDATVGGSSGNAGFDVQLVAQSKIIRFWACSLGMVVFTVRDAYIILGSATDADPLYMVVFIEELPLRSYDCFTVNKTTPYLLLGNNQLVALDPSAGIIEAGFPIADRLIDEYDPAASYLTFHSQSTLDTALYVATGAGSWYRMAANNAPEEGSAWSPKAMLAGFTMGCVQSVEVTPGSYRLLISGTTPGPILQRDRTKNTDNGQKYPADAVIGSIVLAQPGQLAALSFITLESVRIGTRPALALLLGEISGDFDALERTRQDPPILPPSNSLFSDRYHFAQSQKEAWCRHFQMQISWPPEDAPNELFTFTIFGQTWQEMRSQ